MRFHRLMGVVRTRSKVPVVRSRSITTDVTMNMSIIGSTASMIGPMESNGAFPPGGAGTLENTKYSKVRRSAGTTRTRPTVRGSCRSWRTMRMRVANGCDLAAPGAALMPRSP